MKDYKYICENYSDFEDIPDPKNVEEFRILEERFKREFDSEINKKAVVNEEKTLSFMDKLKHMSDYELDQIEEELTTPYVNAICRMNGLALKKKKKKYE